MNVDIITVYELVKLTFPNLKLELLSNYAAVSNDGVDLTTATGMHAQSYINSYLAGMLQTIYMMKNKGEIK